MNNQTKFDKLMKQSSRIIILNDLNLDLSVVHKIYTTGRGAYPSSEFLMSACKGWNRLLSKKVYFDDLVVLSGQMFKDSEYLDKLEYESGRHFFYFVDTLINPYKRSFLLADTDDKESNLNVKRIACITKTTDSGKTVEFRNTLPFAPDRDKVYYVADLSSLDATQYYPMTRNVFPMRPLTILKTQSGA